MKKVFVAFLLVLALAVSICTVSAETVQDVTYKTVELSETDANYYQELAKAEAWNFKQIRNFPTLYTPESFDAYQTVAANVLGYDAENLTDAAKEDLLKVKAAREELVQVRPFIDGLNGEVLYIWGDDMPVTTPEEELIFNNDTYDEADFRPFLIPYLVEDQSQAKGIMLVTSGGGNNWRSNPVEAYAVAPAFVEQGYNVFVLQRRVAPYNNDDIVMDMQRSIRYIKANMEAWGLGGTDIIGSAGFSGSGGNLHTMLDKFYGDITPDQFDSDYVCDEIDNVNSDIDIAIFIYSGSPLDGTENPNIPHTFIAIGADDFMGYEGSFEMFKQMMNAEDPRFKDVHPELHIYAKNGHGFGAGEKGTASELWIPSADLYIQKVMGKNEIVFTGDAPEEYVLQQQVTHSFNNQDVPVMVYTTADHGRYYFAYFMMGEEQIISGKLIGDMPVEPDYDSSGGYAVIYGDHINIWNLVDPTAWEPRQ